MQMMRSGILWQMAVIVISGLKLTLAVLAWILTGIFAGFLILVVGPILVFGAICHSGTMALLSGVRSLRNG
jgi:hypothetical protein